MPSLTSHTSTETSKFVPSLTVNARLRISESLVDTNGKISGTSGNGNDNDNARNRRCLCHFVEGGTTGNSESKSEESKILRCSACVQRSLYAHWERHAQAVEDHARAREECAHQLDAIPHHRNRLGELQVDSQQLRDRLTALRKQCADMAVRVASQAVDNDSTREVTQRALAGGGIQEPQLLLARLDHSFIQGSLHHSLDVASRQVRVLRFQWARKALAMQRLDIDPNDIKLTPLQQRRQQTATISGRHAPSLRRARGIGKIGGLPLPNAGPELYGVLPPKELQSALRLVAAVTSTVARCLGIVLPHPILLNPSMSSSSVSTTGDITDTVSDHELQKRLREHHHATSLHEDLLPAHNSTSTSASRMTTTTTSATTTSRRQPTILSSFGTPPSIGPSSTSSLMNNLIDTSYWKRSAKKALARATGQTALPSASTIAKPYSFAPASSSSTSLANPSTDKSQLSLRIHHAKAAVLAEDDRPNSSQFALSSEVLQEDDFAIGLQLLQNNVIALCLRAGVPISQLWPAEALLLNLYQLDQYCHEQTAVAY